MAQDFRNNFNDDLPTAHNDTTSLLWTGGNYDALISIRLANITTSTVNVDVYVRKSSTDYYLIKNGPIPSGSSLELIDSGSKIVRLHQVQMLLMQWSALSIQLVHRR